ASPTTSRARPSSSSVPEESDSTSRPRSAASSRTVPATRPDCGAPRHPASSEANEDSESGMANSWCVASAIALALLAGTEVHAQAVAPTPQTTPRTPADAKLRALYDGYATWNAKESGVFENARGETKSADYLPRVD